jgi:hypothetical protein
MRTGGSPHSSVARAPALSRGMASVSIARPVYPPDLHRPVQLRVTLAARPAIEVELLGYVVPRPHLFGAQDKINHLFYRIHAGGIPWGRLHEVAQLDELFSGEFQRMHTSH